MNLQTVIKRPAAHRRWLVRFRNKAGLVADHPHPDTALLLLRLIVGITFVLHGIDKLGNLGGTEQFFASLGIPMAEVMSPFVAITEAAGGALLIAGLATPLVAAALAGDMVVAYLTAHVGHGFFVEDGGGELVLLLAVASVAFVLTGAGRYSADAAIVPVRAGRRSASP